MLIKIEAIVREEKMEDVKAALNEIQVNGFTVTQIMGCGNTARLHGICPWFQDRCISETEDQV